MPKSQVAAVLEALGAQIKASLSNKGAGAVTIPGLVKIEKKKVPVRRAEKGVPNPFKPGELMDRPAKPAYNKVKVRALKLLKDMAKQPPILSACKSPRPNSELGALSLQLGRLVPRERPCDNPANDHQPCRSSPRP